MNRPVDGVGVDRFEIGEVFCSFVCYFPISVQLNKPVLVALILDQDRIFDKVLAQQKQLCVRYVSTRPTILGIIVVKSLIDLRV